MGKLTGNLDNITERIRMSLSERDTAREKVLPVSREIIRNCSLAIRAIHRHEFSNAAEFLNNAGDLLSRAGEIVGNFETLANTGYLRDAEKEYSEARTLAAMVSGQPLPSDIDLKIDSSSYLNGLGEAVGELRRYLLDVMRGGDLLRVEEILEAMDDIYCALVTMDFPDGITGNLRRTTDNVRGILEKTRSDVTLITQQKNLEKRLEVFENNLKKDNSK